MGSPEDEAPGGDAATEADEGAEERGEGFAKRALRLARERWQFLVVLALVVAAFLLRLYYLRQYTVYTTDSYYFMILARSLRESFDYSVRGAVHTKYLPGYPSAIFLGGYVFGGIENAANIISLAGGALTVLMTYLLGTELFNRWTGMVAALVVVLQPTFLKWTSLPMTEGMFTFLFTLGVYLMLTGCKKASTARRLVGAAAGGLCLFTRWEGALFIPVAVLIILLYAKGSKLKWWEVPVMLVLVGGPIGVFLLRNVIKTGKLTSYTKESELYNPYGGITYQMLKHNLKVYAWSEGLSDSLFYVFFYLGAILTLVRKRWKEFLILGGWVALFVGFHLFWYYVYERFMAPAVPAVAIFIAFLFVEPGRLLVRAARRDGALTGLLSKGREPAKGPSIAAKTLAALGIAVLVGLLTFLLVHGTVRADRSIEQSYKAMADDHGGSGMVDAAAWLEKNAKGQPVAVDAGPYFYWLHDGTVVYTRPVPWDLMVEDRDVDAPYLVQKLYDRGVRYMVLADPEQIGNAAELERLGLRPEDIARLKQVAIFRHHYTYPRQVDVDTVIYELLPVQRGQTLLHIKAEEAFASRYQSGDMCKGV